MGASAGSNFEVLGLAWSLGWRIAAGFLIGYWLDGRLGTGPWLTLLLSLSALAAGVVQMLRATSHTDGDSAPGPAEPRA